MANYNKFIPWWTSLPDEIRDDIVDIIRNKKMPINELCQKYKQYKMTPNWVFYIKKRYGLLPTYERDLKIAQEYASGIPDYILKRDYGIDNAEFRLIKDLVYGLGLTSKKLF
jgi:hypothetical protein